MLIDLLKYEFNHSQSNWVESRASQSLRMRESTRHKLLGMSSADWNPLDPTWRIIIRQSELPWLSHHTFDNTVLYPAGGMLAMVLKGIRSLAAGSNVSGYRLRDNSRQSCEWPGGCSKSGVTSLLMVHRQLGTIVANRQTRGARRSTWLAGDGGSDGKTDVGYGGTPWLNTRVLSWQAGR